MSDTTLHFLHIGKTGGTAVKEALEGAGLAYRDEAGRDAAAPTRLGRIKLHTHGVQLHELPPGDSAFFFLRDPVARFLSAFNSALNRGRPRYDFEWTPDEQAAFERFPTPQELAVALNSDDEEERTAARAASRRIRHMQRMTWWVGTPSRLRRRLDRVAYIGRQETLADDWAQLKSMLGLPAGLELPSDPVAMHRGDYQRDGTLDEAAVRSLKEWFAPDYELLALCDEVRARNGWGRPDQPPKGRLRSALRLTRRAP